MVHGRSRRPARSGADDNSAFGVDASLCPSPEPQRHRLRRRDAHRRPRRRRRELPRPVRLQRRPLRPPGRAPQRRAPASTRRSASCAASTSSRPSAQARLSPRPATRSASGSVTYESRSTTSPTPTERRVEGPAGAPRVRTELQNGDAWTVRVQPQISSGCHGPFDDRRHERLRPGRQLHLHPVRGTYTLGAAAAGLGRRSPRRAAGSTTATLSDALLARPGRAVAASSRRADGVVEPGRLCRGAAPHATW